MGNFYVIDPMAGEVKSTYKGHTGPINFFVEVPAMKTVVTAGDDTACLFFDLTQEPIPFEKRYLPDGTEIGPRDLIL